MGESTTAPAPGTWSAPFDLMDPGVQNCPYAAYAALREMAPVYRDPATGYYVVSRYADLRQVLLDTENFINQNVQVFRSRIRPSRTMKAAMLYQKSGWVPTNTLAGRDNPEHRELRSVFDWAFRPGHIRELEPFISGLAYNLIDRFAADGQCDWVAQYAVPMSLTIIATQMGAREEDLPNLKRWTDAFARRMGMMLSGDEEFATVATEIEAQHYFQPIFERLRGHPDGSLLGDIVNKMVPEWGRTLTDRELHTEVLVDIFVAGSETTTNAIASGLLLLIDNPHVWAALKQDRERYLKTFIEEVVRLETPVQGLFRVAARETVLGGVTIPKDAIVNVRYAAANRDELQFPNAECLDLERRNAGAHLGFGSGLHHCLGASLARCELHWAFTAVLDRFERIWLRQERESVQYHPSYVLRALSQLQIGFEMNPEPSPHRAVA